MEDKMITVEATLKTNVEVSEQDVFNAFKKLLVRKYGHDFIEAFIVQNEGEKELRVEGFNDWGNLVDSFVSNDQELIKLFEAYQTIKKALGY